MTATGAALGGLALVQEPSLRRPRLRALDLLSGAAIAAGLYAVFAGGDRLARRVMPRGGDDIADIYQLRQLRPAPELGLRLALVMGPSEELFWRGLVQGRLSRRLGRDRGAAASAALYGGAHLCTGNPTLVAAASVAGAAWSGLAAAGVPLAALAVSHSLWDVWIFLLRPTRPRA